MSWENYWRKYSGPNYRLYFIIGIILVLAIVVYYYQYKPTVTSCATTFCPADTVCKDTVNGPVCVPIQVITTTTTQLPTTGKLAISIKDVPRKISGLGNVTGLNLSISSIDVHKGEGNDTNDTNYTSGWITVIANITKFNLLDYQQVANSVGIKDLDVGKYTQIRLNLQDSEIKIYYFWGDVLINNKSYPLIVPSKEIKLIHPFTIEAGKTLSLTLDFDVEHSVVHEADGYKLKPVIKIIENP